MANHCNKTVLSTLVLLLVSFLIPLALSAETAITEPSPPKELQLPGQMMQISFQVQEPASQASYFLLTSLDNQSTLLKPSSERKSDSGIVLNFKFPAPILTLEYFILAQKQEKVIYQSPVKSLERNCIPKLDDYFDVDSKTAKSSAAKQLLSNTKELENDFSNYQSSTEQLEDLINLMGW